MFISQLLLIILFVHLLPLLKLMRTTKNLKNCVDRLESNQYIDDNRRNKKTGNFATTFHKPVGEANPYVGFGYIPLTI